MFSIQNGAYLAKGGMADRMKYTQLRRKIWESKVVQEDFVNIRVLLILVNKRIHESMNRNVETA